jgi:anti-sigma factor RsiW
MNREMQLKLQAYLDGELSGRDARSIEEWVERDSAAKALLEELRCTKAFVSANEPELKLPETREFYWGKIERAIEAAEPNPEPTTTLAAVLWERFLAWRKYLVPLAATALVTFLAISTITFTQSKDSWRQAEVENISEHTGSFSFRSQAENMFVVWVYEKPEPATESYEDIDLYDEDYWIYE